MGRSPKPHIVGFKKAAIFDVTEIVERYQIKDAEGLLSMLRQYSVEIIRPHRKDILKRREAIADLIGNNKFGSRLAKLLEASDLLYPEYALVQILGADTLDSEIAADLLSQCESPVSKRKGISGDQPARFLVLQLIELWKVERKVGKEEVQVPNSSSSSLAVPSEFQCFCFAVFKLVGAKQTESAITSLIARAVKFKNRLK